MNRPSLFSNTMSPTQSYHADSDSTVGTTSRLADMLHDGFYLLLLLKNGYIPQDAVQFADRVKKLLDEFDRQARLAHIDADDVYAAKYAFCAAIDEAVLSSNLSIREFWELSPLQLTLFGDQLAGENFFVKLEQLRHRGIAGVQALEVFYLCLLTGFQGKYMLESKEKLNYLIATLDKEITHLKGKRATFSPHWKSPDNVKHLIKTDIPMWIIGTALVLLGIATYSGLNWMLSRQVNLTLGDYYDIIKLAPQVANITISLP